MRGETWPTWLNRPYSCEKPKPEMEYMSTSNCSLRKNDQISLTLTTFSPLFVALKLSPPWMMAVGNLHSYAVNNLCWHIFDFWSFLALFSHNPSRHSRSSDLILILGCMTSNLLVLELLHFLLLGCPLGKAQSKKGTCPPRLCRKKTKWQTDQVSRPPFPCVVANLLMFEGKGWVISD